MKKKKKDSNEYDLVHKFMMMIMMMVMIINTFLFHMQMEENLIYE